MKIYSIEGNIGSGKTSLHKHVLRCSDEVGTRFEFVPESAKRVFRSVPRLLDHYYRDPAKYCEEVNRMIIDHGRLSLRGLYRDCNTVILDSSLLATRNVFLPSAVARNILSADVGEGLIKTIDDFLDKESIEIIPVWLPTKPEVCLERIKRRGRLGESNITLNLLHRHHFLYENWLRRDAWEILTDRIDIDRFIRNLVILN